tara:strand:+ start:1177 stop:1380 length:204 start_codon:yes stop_codon:yes gene_type:complete
MSTQEFLLARIEALENEVKALNRDLNLHTSTLEATIIELIDCIKEIDSTNEILKKAPFRDYDRSNRN